MEPCLADIARAPVELSRPSRRDETVLSIVAVADASWARGVVFLVAGTTGEQFCKHRADAGGMEWLADWLEKEWIERIVTCWQSSHWMSPYCVSWSKVALQTQNFWPVRDGGGVGAIFRGGIVGGRVFTGW